VLAVAKPGDAIFNEAQLFQKWLREWGYVSDIYAEGIDCDLPPGAAYPYAKLRGKRSDTLLIYHYSIGSDLSPFVRGLSLPILLVYHNITPCEFFRGVHQQLYDNTRRGREELATFSTVPLALGVSEFNSQELLALGFESVGILPLPVDEERYAVAPDAETMERFGQGGTNILFVGRIVPNKRQEDIIRTFYYYKRIDPASRLFLVGSPEPCTRYRAWLDGYVKFLGLSDVHFCGHVTTAELVAYYRLADVFLCMSEHEGFCVPLVESMYFGLPILAYASTGVPHTLGNAGVLFCRKDFPVVAEIIHLLTTDAALRSRLIEHQRERLESFRPNRIRVLLRAHLDTVISRLQASS